MKNPSFRIFKPIPLIILIFLAALPPFNFYLLLALLFSLAGDLFLLNKEKFFTYGLLSFLFAHLTYVFLFSSLGSSPSILVGLITVFLMEALYVIIRKTLGKYARPVALYMIVISLMVFFSLGFNGGGGLFIGFGGILFVISDGVLAINKFYKSIKHSEAVILTTYYLAQLLIVSGVKYLLA